MLLSAHKHNVLRRKYSSTSPDCVHTYILVLIQAVCQASLFILYERLPTEIHTMKLINVGETLAYRELTVRV